MTNEKMTMREFMNTVATMDGMSDAMVEFATAEIEKIDAANEKRRAKNAEKAAANQPLLDALESHLSGEPQTASDLKEVIEVSVQKTSSLLRELVKQGKASVKDVKVKRDGKTSTLKGYTLPVSAEVATDAE